MRFDSFTLFLLNSIDLSVLSISRPMRSERAPSTDSYLGLNTLCSGSVHSGTYRRGNGSKSSIFVDGTYGVCYDRSSMQPFADLKFIDGKVHGPGFDKEGPYIVGGYYSEISQRIAVSKVHSISGVHSNKMYFVRLEWSTLRQRFEGKWYIQSRNAFYSGIMFIENGHFSPTHDRVSIGSPDRIKERSSRNYSEWKLKSDRIRSVADIMNANKRKQRNVPKSTAFGRTLRLKLNDSNIINDE